MIRRAVETDLPTLLEITDACAADMKKRGIFQWNETYPNTAIFRKDLEEEALYVFVFENAVIGCIMFSEEKDALYNQIQWLTPDEKNLYVHRLAVHPHYQKQGVGRKLMDFAEDYAKKKQYLSVRLDTFSKNPRNLRFYTARGYTKLGDVYFVKQSKDPFHCFEKVIK